MSSKQPRGFPQLIPLLRLGETLHTICIWSLLYSWTITHFGQPDGLNKVTWSLAASFVISPVLGSVVQVRATHPHVSRVCTDSARIDSLSTPTGYAYVQRHFSSRYSYGSAPSCVWHWESSASSFSYARRRCRSSSTSTTGS